MAIDIEKFGRCISFITEDGCPEIQVNYDSEKDMLHFISMKPEPTFELSFTADGVIIYDICPAFQGGSNNHLKCLSEKIRFHYDHDSSHPCAMTFSYRKENHSFHYETSLKEIKKPLEGNIYMQAELLLAKQMIRSGFLDVVRAE